jgi:hypothetical protein
MMTPVSLISSPPSSADDESPLSMYSLVELGFSRGWEVATSGDDVGNDVDVWIDVACWPVESCVDSKVGLGVGWMADEVLGGLRFSYQAILSSYAEVERTSMSPSPSRSAAKTDTAAFARVVMTS